MNCSIIGCGRVGALVANKLSKEKHNVTIVDMNKNAFLRLDKNFSGKTIVGSGYNKSILNSMHLENVDAFISVTNGDNTNIICSRIAKIEYNIKNVVSRIYDPKRASLYNKLGIVSIPISQYGANEIITSIFEKTSLYIFEDKTKTVAINNFSYHDSFIGVNINEINKKLQFANIAYITRDGEKIIPTIDTIIQDDDEIDLIFKKKDEKNIIKILNKKYEK